MVGEAPFEVTMQNLPRKVQVEVMYSGIINPKDTLTHEEILAADGDVDKAIEALEEEKFQERVNILIEDDPQEFLSSENWAVENVETTFLE